MFPDHEALKRVDCTLLAPSKIIEEEIEKESDVGRMCDALLSKGRLVTADLIARLVKGKMLEVFAGLDTAYLVYIRATNFVFGVKRARNRCVPTPLGAFGGNLPREICPRRVPAFGGGRGEAQGDD